MTHEQLVEEMKKVVDEEIIKEFDEMPFGVTIPFNEKMMWGEIEGFQADGREEFKEWLRGKLTTALQRAYEAGREERDTYWKERVREETIEEVRQLKKTGNNGEGLPFEKSPEIYGNQRIEAYKNGFNSAIDQVLSTLNK